MSAFDGGRRTAREPPSAAWVSLTVGRHQGDAKAIDGLYAPRPAWHHALLEHGSMQNRGVLT